MSPSRSFRARAADAPPDLALALRLIEQAERHIASAGIPGIDPESRFGMLHDAARKGADAVMRATGRRVTTGTGHHIVFLAEAKRLLPPEHTRTLQLVESVEAAS